VPLICRRGGVVKADIGRIVILPKETRFLIRSSAAQRFAQASRRPDKRSWLQQVVKAQTNLTRPSG
jgi:ATP-dependent RNA helicase DeaD